MPSKILYLPPPAGANLQLVPCPLGQIVFAFAKQGTGRRPAPAANKS